LLTLSLASVPTCWLAHCLQAASSDWNTSKGFPGPGITLTLGPAGIVAQPVNATKAKSNKKIPFKFILPCPPLLPGEFFDFFPLVLKRMGLKSVDIGLKSISSWLSNKFSK
jgi:hypothetical protein